VKALYKIGICDDDKILCSALEEQIYGISKELAIKVVHPFNNYGIHHKLIILQLCAYFNWIFEHADKFVVYSLLFTGNVS
jgi:hypothetical protein